jgi:hypothetical protein
MKAHVDATVTESVGSLLVLDCDSLHTPNAGVRTGDRIVQVVSRELTPTGSILELLDMGPYLDAPSAPTVAIAQSATEPRHTLRCTLSNLSGLEYELQLARGTATDWFSIASGTATIIDVGGLASNTTYYARCRLIAPQRLRSEWSSEVNATTASYAAPTSVSATATDNELALTWSIPTESAGLNIEVWYDTVTPFSTTTATPFETFGPGTTGCTINDGLATETLYYCYVRFVDMYGGVSATASDSDTTGVAAGTLAAPDELHIERGTSYGTRTAP